RYDKFTAFSRAVTMSMDNSTVQLDNLADQSQSDAKPSGRPFQTLAVLNKQFKNVRQHGRRNSASPILHFECDRFAINACGEMDGTARRRISGRVRQQIHDNLLHSCSVATDG